MMNGKNFSVIRSVFLMLSLLTSMSLSSQKLTVESMRLLANDATAMAFENQRQDLNDDYAGIVKVMLAANGAKFQGGGVMEHKLYEISEYWVWMAKGSKRIKIHAPGYLPLEVNFFDDYGIKVESKRTYELVLTLPMGYTPPAQVETVEEISPSLSEAEMTAFQMNELGKDYFYGRNGVEKDHSEAVKWFRKAAERGDANGQNNLGCMYQNGYGVDKDYAEAMKWFRLSAEQGNASGQFSLGLINEKGSGVEQDYSEAVKWYRLAAEQGDARGQCNLGHMFQSGLGVKKDYSEAVKWYRLAAEQGDATGQNNLGTMYANGLGVKRDYSEAFKWVRLAAEQGDANAQANLGYMFQSGLGVKKDYSEAVKWYRLSAEQGYARGQYDFGLIYYYGYGVKKDRTQAKYWLEKAAAQGYENAMKALLKLNDK